MPAPLLLFGLLFIAAADPAPPDLASEVENTRFVASSYGIEAAVLNPAGLAARPGDDGILLNYSFPDSNYDRGERNFLWSMGGLGLSYQNERSRGGAPRFDLYQLSMAVGGQRLSLGMRGKLIEVHDEYRQTFDMDLGFDFHPVPGLCLGGMVRDPAEAEIREGLHLRRSYRAGASLVFGRERVTLNAEGIAPDSARAADEVTWRAGVSIRPLRYVSATGGWEVPAGGGDDSFWGGAWFHLEGLVAGMTARSLGGKNVRLAAELRLGLQTVRF